MSAILIISILLSSSTLLVSSTTLIIPYDDDNLNSLPVKLLPWPPANVKYQWQPAPVEPTADSSQVMQEQVQFVLQDEPIVQQKESSTSENSTPSNDEQQQQMQMNDMQVPQSDQVEQKNTPMDEQSKMMDQPHQVKYSGQEDEQQLDQGQQKEHPLIMDPKQIVQQQSQYTPPVEQQQQQQQDEGDLENVTQMKQDPRQEEDSPFQMPNEPTDKVPPMKKEPKIPVFITRDPSKIIALSRMYARKFKGLMRSEDKSHEVSLAQEDPNESTIEGETINSESSEESASPAAEEVEVEEANDNVPSVEQSLPVASSSDPSDDSITIPARDPSKTIPVIAISGVEPYQVFRQRVRPNPRVVPQVTKDSIEENKKLTRRQKNYLARVLDDYFKFILDFQGQKKKEAQVKKEETGEKMQRRTGLFGSWKRNIKSLFMPIMTIRNSRSFKPFIPVPPEPLVSIAVLGKK